MTKKVKPKKNGNAQKKRSGHEIRGVSPEAGRESMVEKICPRGSLVARWSRSTKLYSTPVYTGGYTTSVYDQPLRPTQHSTLGGTENEYRPKCGDVLRLGNKGRYGSLVGR